jgi:hypothetical protein
MVWLFERGDQSLRLETRYDSAAGDYALVIHHEEGAPQVEHFKDEIAFRGRLAALEAQLRAERWTASGPPVLLKDGWKLT